jgi:hypothetical protein
MHGAHFGWMMVCMVRSAEARKVLRELDAELAASSERPVRRWCGPPPTASC